MTTPGSPDFQDATALLEQMLREWGLDELVPDARQMLIEGYSPTTIPLRLQNTPAYKERFKANEQRIAKGLPALSPSEYVQQERGYMRVLRQYGLPESFYDERSDFENWIAGDVSINEMETRVKTEVDTWTNASAEYKTAWLELMGLTPGDAIAAFLDPKRSLPELQRKAETAAIGGEQIRAYGSAYLDTARAQQLAALGVTRDAARRGFQEVGARMSYDQYLARIQGRALTKEGLEDEVLLGDQRQAALRQSVYDTERAKFNEGYTATRQGPIGRETRGTY